jgi:pimeloyl-ACP methyl ester carboxylesterase
MPGMVFPGKPGGSGESNGEDATAVEEPAGTTATMTATSGRAEQVQNRPRVFAWVVALVVLMAMAVLTSGCGGPSTASAVGTARGRLLSVADLPAGWSVVPAIPESVQASAPCLLSLPANPKGYTYARAGFVEGTSLPSVNEVLATGPQAQQMWLRLGRVMARCRTATFTTAGERIRATVRPLPFPRVASTSSAYVWAFTSEGVRIGVDFVLFQAGGYAGYLTYADLGPPAVATAQAFVAAAVAKAETGSTTRVTSVSIVSAPVRTAPTQLGAVAYRITGNGPPLVLITGYSGTMQNWDPRFVDALAEHYRVVIFDNAGIGPTAALPAPLSIDAMANQTSALIKTLGLGRPDVLGWSMGSLIAQALAVLHPDQVRRLVLCASWPGNGQGTRPSAQALSSGELFPAHQTSAQNTYHAAILAYPLVPAAPAATLTAQVNAIGQWWAGRDPAGTQPTKIAAPTLIADGTEDQLVPLANSHALASLIPGARLTLYPDAGHAFLFQDQTAFVPLIESFLG